MLTTNTERILPVPSRPKVITLAYLAEMYLKARALMSEEEQLQLQLQHPIQPVLEGAAAEPATVPRPSWKLNNYRRAAIGAMYGVYYFETTATPGLEEFANVAVLRNSRFESAPLANVPEGKNLSGTRLLSHFLTRADNRVQHVTMACTWLERV